MLLVTLPIMFYTNLKLIFFYLCLVYILVIFCSVDLFVLCYLKKKKKQTNKQFVSLSNLFLIAMTLELVAATKFQQSHEQCLTAFVKSFLMMA